MWNVSKYCEGSNESQRHSVKSIYARFIDICLLSTMALPPTLMLATPFALMPEAG